MSDRTSPRTNILVALWLLLILSICCGLAITACGGGSDDEGDSNVYVSPDDDDDITPPADDDDDNVDDDDDDTTDDDDDITDDDDDITDDDDDVTDDDDDSTPEPLPISIRILPHGDAIPIGAETQFQLEVTWDNDVVNIDPPGAIWLLPGREYFGFDDDHIADAKNEGFAYLIAIFSWVDALLIDYVPVLAGPDLFFANTNTGGLGAIDYMAETIDNGFAPGPYSVEPQVIRRFERYLGVVDGGDDQPGVTGDEKVVVFDLITQDNFDYPLDVDSPAGLAFAGEYMLVTGKFSDELAVVELDGGAATYIDLPADCAPEDIVMAQGKAYIACTALDYGSGTFGQAKIVVFDPDDQSTSSINLTGKNPGSLNVTEDEDWVYVVSRGNGTGVVGRIEKVDTNTNTLGTGFTLGTTLDSASLAADGKLFVAEDNNLYVVDTAADTVLRGTANPIVVAAAGNQIIDVYAHPDVDQVYVSFAQVTKASYEIKSFDTVAYGVEASYLPTGPAGSLFAW